MIGRFSPFVWVPVLLVAAAPFLLVMVGLCASLWKGLLDDIEVHGHFEELDPETGGVKDRA